MPDPGKVGLPILMKLIAEVNFNEIFRNPKSLYFLTFDSVGPGRISDQIEMKKPTYKIA